MRQSNDQPTRNYSKIHKVVSSVLVLVVKGVVGWCWVNFRCRGVLLIWMMVGQGPAALAVGAGYLDTFTIVYRFSLLSPSLWETPRYRLKYCFKRPLSPKQPTNHLVVKFPMVEIIFCQSRSEVSSMPNSDNEFCWHHYLLSLGSTASFSSLTVWKSELK